MTGVAYRWRVTLDDHWLRYPPWVLMKMAVPRGHALRELRHNNQPPLTAVESVIPEGRRNDTLWRLGRKLRFKGADGEVIGIVTATADTEEFLSETGSRPQNVNWAVKIEHATPLFDLPSPQPPARTRAEAIERASRAVCIVIMEIDRTP